MSRRVRTLILYNGPTRVMRVIAWIYLALFVFQVGVRLLAGLPPTWLTVINAAFFVPIANDLIKSHRLKTYFGGEAVTSITMSKVEAPSEAERMRN